MPPHSASNHFEIYSQTMLNYKLLAFLLLTGVVQACEDRPTELTKDWWETAQIYEINVRSFMDSDGDGIGDLKGVIAKLDYLKELGITAAWLTPIFKSPFADFGYDIADYYQIQWEYGTMADFRALIKRANELGIKIILDFVPNHTSNQHEWFRKSEGRQKGFEDFYVWADGRIDENGKRQPPSNWLQAYRGSAWHWNERRQQYYLHQFSIQQPDLNFRNPQVVREMKNVLNFWLEEGVAGFRCAAVPMLFEVEANSDGTYPDLERSGLTEDPLDRRYFKSNLIEDQPETIEMIYEWRKVMDDFQRWNGGETRVLLIESYSAANFTMQMYGNRTHQGAHLPFNFNLIMHLNEDITAPKVQKAIDSWLKQMPAGRTANWVLGNHDQRRAANRYGVFRANAMNMLLMVLPGASVTYQGEELGMIDGVISWEDTRDPQACQTNPSLYESYTRDPARTPFHWTAGRNAGFSTASKTWLPLAPEHEQRNVASESLESGSHLAVFKHMITLRKQFKSLQLGYTKYTALNENIFVLKRYLAGEISIIYLANFGSTRFTLNLELFDRNLPKHVSVLLHSTDSTNNLGTSRAVVSVKSIALDAGEALVLSTSASR